MVQELSGEAVLLNVQTGMYYGLSKVGTRMWVVLREYGQVDLAYQKLLQEYEVDNIRLEKDLLRLVNELEARGLLVVNEN